MEQLSFYAPVAPPPRTPTDEVLYAEFAIFWGQYPKRPNNPRHTAMIAYRKARAFASAEEILAGLQRYDWDDRPRLRPMAATWLNQRRWTCTKADLAADPWGLGEHLSDDALFTREALDPILFATGWPETWRGHLDVLDAWIRDGYEPSSIAATITEAVEQFGPRSSLRHFDTRVRAKAARFT